jgi:hypothetical protein
VGVPNPFTGCGGLVFGNSLRAIRHRAIAPNVCVLPFLVFAVLYSSITSSYRSPFRTLSTFLSGSLLLALRETGLLIPSQ